MYVLFLLYNLLFMRKLQEDLTENKQINACDTTISEAYNNKTRALFVKYFNSLQPEHISVIMLIIYDQFECVMQIHIVNSSFMSRNSVTLFFCNSYSIPINI